MAKLPDGHVFIYRPMRTRINIEEKELVTCKNCKHGNYYALDCYSCKEFVGVHGPDFYCANGEKRSE